MANDVNANIRIDLDTSDAVASLKTLQAQISAFNQSVIKSNASAVAAQQNMLSTLTAQVGATRQFTTSMVNVETSVSKLGRAIDKNKLSLGEYFRYGVASSKNFGRVFGREHTAVMELAADRVKRLQTQYIALGEAQNGMTRAMAIRPLQLFNADASIAVQRQQLFNKLLHDGSTSLVNFGKNTQWAGRQLMVGFTVPLTIFGGIAGKIFMDLERQVVNFRRVYGDATTPLEETNGMIVQVQELAKEFTKYGIAVSDTVALASDAAAAGAQGEDLLAATAQATRLSTLGMIDQQQALTATIALQSAFRLNTEELANSVNFLNAVENQTVVSLADITEAIPKVAPVIKGLGGDVEDLAVFMAALREGGVSAGEGANALKSGLASLINPTKNAREQLEKVGINIDEILKANKGDIQGTVRAFGDALMTLGKFERQQTLAKVFGKYQFARLGALFENISRDGSQAQRVVDLTAMSIQELGSLAEKELGAIEESVGTKFTGAMERLKLAIAPVGEAFLKIATPIIEFATKMFEKFNELSPSVKNFIVILTAGLGVVVPTVIMLIGLFANFAGNAVKGLSLMNNFFNRLRGGAGTLDYLSNEQLDAAAAAASLEGKTESLTSAINVQRSAINQLAKAYGTYAASARATAGNLPQGFRSPRPMASGGMVGGTGNKDSEPALLTPGEFVMNRGATEKFGPILDAMNRGNVSLLARGSRQSGAESRQFKSGAFVLRGLGANISAGGSTGILSDILSVSADSITEVTSLYVSEIAKAAGTSVTSINKEIKSWQESNRAYLTKFNKELATAIEAGDIGAQQKLISEANEKFISDMRRLNGPTAKFAAEAERQFPALTQDLRRTQDIIKKTKLDLSDAQQSASFFEQNMKETALLSKLSKPGTYQPQSRAAAAALPFLGYNPQVTGIPGQFIDPRVRGTAGRESSMGLTAAQASLLYKAGTSAEHIMKTPAQLQKEADVAAKIYATRYSNTIAEEDGTGKGLAKEAGRRSPHRQAKQNARQDAGAYAQTYALTVNDELSRQLQEKFPQLRQSGAGRVAIARPEDTGRMHDIDQAHMMAIEEDTKRTKEVSKEKKTLRQKISGTAGKVAGFGLAADGLIFAASMMDNSVGQFAQQIMPAVFAFQGIAMMLPMMMNPIGAVTMGLAASAAAIWFFKSKADEMTKNVQKFSDSMIATQSTIDKVGEFYGTKSLAERQSENVIQQQTGAGAEDVQKAQDFVASEVGIAMQEGLGMAFQKFGASAAADQFAANLASMVLQGVVSPEQAKSIAIAMGQSLGNEQFGINVNGKLNELLGPDNTNLLENPLQLAIDISEQNQKTVQGLAKDFDSLALSMQNFGKWTAGDTAAAFVPVYGVINTINKATLGWDNWFGQVARSARGILNPDDFEGVEASLKTIGSLVGNQVAQGYDNLSAAKARYKQISEQVAKIDKDDIAAKKAAKRAAREAKDDINELTRQLQQQESSFRTMFAQGTDMARTTVLEGMRESITQQFENDPAMKLAWDMISGQMGDVSQDIQFNINMGISSGVLNPIAIQNLMQMFANPTEATATINFLINTYGTGTTNEMILNILNMKDPKIQKEAIIDLIVNTPGIDDETLALLDPTGTIRVEAEQRRSENKRSTGEVDTEAINRAKNTAQQTRKIFEDELREYQSWLINNVVPTDFGAAGGEILGLKQTFENAYAGLESIEMAIAAQDPMMTVDELEKAKNESAEYQAQLEEVLNAQVALTDAVANNASENYDAAVAVQNREEVVAKSYGNMLDAEKAYNEELGKTQRVSADTAERRAQEARALVPLKNEYYSLASALEAAENPVNIKINEQGLTASELELVNKNLAIFSQFPSESVKIAGVESIGSPEQLAALTENYKGLESTKPRVVKKAILEVLGAQGVNAKEAMAQINNMGYSLEEFAKLPNSTKYAILYNLEVDAKLNLELSNIESLLSNPLLTPQAASSLLSQRDRIKGQLEKIRNELSALFDTTDDGGGDGNGDGADGGGAGKSWLEQLLADTKANIALFVGNLEKGIKPLVNRLRKLRIPEQIIDAIGTGEEGLTRAQEVLGMSKAQRRDFINQQNRSIVGQFLRGPGGLNARVRGQESRDKAEQKILANRKMDGDLLKEILDDEEAVNAILAARGKELDRILNRYEQLQTVEEVINSKVKEVKDQHEKTEKILNKQIEDQQEIVNAIQEQIDVLEKKNEEDQWTIRGKEREKELIDRQIEALDLANEMDQRKIDNLQRQDELRNREADTISRELDAMSELEDQIRKSYQERIDALDKVAEVNNKILEQQRQQLGLSQALSEGDIFAATAAAQQMRQSQAQFAQEQARAGLEQGMENAVAGLRTSGGLTREQAEDRIKQIKEQSYQTSLLIRDIEDRIYERNQQIIPLKDQQRIIDDQIRVIQDQIYARETQIYDMRKNQLGPAENILSNLNDQKVANQKITDELINQIEALADTEKGTNNAAKKADALAKSWHEVQKAIANANKLANNRLLTEVGDAPVRQAGETDAEFAKRVDQWKTKRQEILNQRNADIDAALASGTASMNAANLYGGGKVMKYGMGKKVMGYAAGSIVGAGSRDSVPAMLTPGEFVIRKAMVDKYGTPLLQAINQGAFGMPRFNTAQVNKDVSVKAQPSSNIVAPMYNNYSVNVSVSGTNASADEIANKTIMKIKQMQDMQIRSSRGY